ncbi:MAG: hypothetical protein E7076_04945 [Bacteroidales bacterium]|nr:hypothetical protein [Bacteroidales bacterium]
MKNEITQGLFRMSAILYARNNSSTISTKQIIRKIIEDALYNNSSDKAIAISLLIESITKNYAITLSHEEILAVIKDQKFTENFDYYDDGGIKVSLKNKRRKLIEQEQVNNKNLNDYIVTFVKNHNLDKSKIDVFYRFLYSVFTTNLEGFKLLLKEKSILQIDDSTFGDEDKVIINEFLDWDDKGKNEAIFNLASFALEYCMLTNKKDALFEINNLRNKNLYIDSNIIFRALGVNGEDRKLRTEQFLSKFHSVRQDLFITKETDIEIKETIDYYITKLNRATTPAARVKPEVYLETVDIDGFYKLYFKWRVNRTDGSVSSFKTHLLAKYEELQKRFHIQKDSVRPYKEDDIKELISDYESQIIKYCEDKSYTAASVDARNIIWMEYKRNGQNDDIYQVKYFFVSSDQHLRHWDYNRNTNEIPIVMLPSQWLSMVLRYMERTDDDYKSFVCFLNMKVSHPTLSEEQLLYAIEGISEITSDIKQQTFLIKSFIKEDFNNELQGLANEKLQEKAKDFAETKFDKRLKELESESQVKESHITRLTEESLEKKKALAKANKNHKKQEELKGKLKSENAEYKNEINKHRREKREVFVNNQLRKWRWRTWWWLIGVGVLLFFLLTVTVWLQILKPETNEFFKMLTENPIVTIIGTIISAAIEIPLIVNICGKYDISKIKEFKEQLTIPDNLQELK